MKKLYWRPGKVSRRIHLFVALMAALGLLAVEGFKIRTQQAHYQEKVKAARLMLDAMEAIRDFRIKRIGPLDLETDPASSGMIGGLMSPITSNTGNLQAKQTTVNPNWAAVIVHMLKRAGVK
ncbi:MAG: poly-gamma-glutamate system protein, partial [Deltaproteobacteria bacterium]|nr:poly-gamma-glutamate system protein [Deltaproteobacteria bacterium]